MFLSCLSSSFWVRGYMMAPGKCKKAGMHCFLVFLALLVTRSAAAASDVQCYDRASCGAAVAVVAAAVREWPFLSAGVSFLHEMIDSADDSDFSATPSAVTSSTQPPSAANYCPSNGAFEFVPVFQRTVKLNTSEIFSPHGFGVPCFKQITATFSTTAPGGDDGGSRWGYLHFESHGLPASLTCGDAYVAATPFLQRKLTVGLANKVVKPMHLNITYTSADEFAYIKKHGIHIFVNPCGLAGTVLSVAATAKLFTGTPASIDRANRDFLLGRSIFPSLDDWTVPAAALDTSKVKSGDNIQVLKLDGLDPLVMWGTGGRTGHTTLAVWHSDGGPTGTRELFVVESTDKSPLNKEYWPPPYGMIKTPWAQWIKQAEAAGFNAVILPLSKAAAEAFDETAFWAWFAGVEGMPYGYHVFLTSFLDTAGPAQNLPLPIVDETMSYVLPKLDRLLGHDNETAGTGNLSMGILLGQPVNRRLGVPCPDKGSGLFNCLSAELVKRGMTWAEASAIPEDDDWRYDASSNDPGNFALACSMFVTRGYRAAFAAWSGWAPVNATEFTPKDVYQLNIFADNTEPRFGASDCARLISSPRGSYCQLAGDIKLVLNEFNTVPVTPGMNAHCAAQWPEYDKDTQRPC